MRLKKNKGIIKIALYTLLVLGGIGLMSFPQTYSSFNDKNDTALVYKSKLYNLYNSFTMNLQQATVDYARFTFTFTTNKAVLSNEKDVYQVLIPENCTFDDLSTSGVAFLDKSSHSVTINYDANSNREGINTVSITCSVEPNKNLNYIANITEIVDQKQLLYIKYTYEESYSNYLGHVYEKVENSETISGKVNKLYDTFIAWVTEYGKYVGYEDTILAYVKNTYPNESALKNPNNFNSLLGFRIEYDSVKDEYTFKVLDNFVGYARTYNYCKNGMCSRDGILLYFSTDTKGSIYTAFQNYLSLYVYPNNTDAVNYVYNYSYSNNRLYDMIFNGTEINGISLIEKTPDVSNIRMTLQLEKNTILSTAISSSKNSPYIAFGTSEAMSTSFAYVLMDFYGDYSIDTLLEIFEREDIIASITKNSTDGTSVGVFKDYFIQKDGNRYLLIKVYSDGSYNMFNITPVSVSNDISITFNNTTNKLTINVKGSTESNVKQVITNLDGYFGTSTTISADNIKSNTATEYIVEYTITK